MKCLNTAVQLTANTNALCLGCSGNVDGHKDNLAPENYDAYVDYLTEVVGYYRHEMNLTFRTIEPFNEPTSWNWHAGNDQDGCHYDGSTQDIILQVCHQTFVASHYAAVLVLMTHGKIIWSV